MEKNLQKPTEYCNFAATKRNRTTFRLILLVEIVAIYPQYIYSIQYEEQNENEFDRLFALWNDVDYVNQFLVNNQKYLSLPTWQQIQEPEDAARQVLAEAANLEELFEDLYQNVLHGRKPDFDRHFSFWEGKYKYSLQWPPMKSYGTYRPSLLRIYAVKMEKNLYLITGGGIKLADTIQNSPDLKDHVLQNIDKVRTFLRENGILEAEDM